MTVLNRRQMAPVAAAAMAVPFVGSAAGRPSRAEGALVSGHHSSWCGDGTAAAVLCWLKSRAITSLTHNVTQRDLRVPISSMRAQISESICQIASGGRVQKMILGKSFSRLPRLSKAELDCTGQSQIAPQSTQCPRYLDFPPQLSSP